jgi:hypothetical protein
LHSSLPNVSNEIRISFDLRYNPISQPTGRSAFPGFVARSRRAPEAELRDAAEWARRWMTARDRLADLGQDLPFNRWSATDPVCA